MRSSPPTMHTFFVLAQARPFLHTRPFYTPWPRPSLPKSTRLHAFGLASGRTCIAFNLGDNLPPTYKPEPGAPLPPSRVTRHCLALRGGPGVGCDPCCLAERQSGVALCWLTGALLPLVNRPLASRLQSLLSLTFTMSSFLFLFCFV